MNRLGTFRSNGLITATGRSGFVFAIGLFVFGIPVSARHRRRAAGGWHKLGTAARVELLIVCGRMFSP